VKTDSAGKPVWIDDHVDVPRTSDAVVSKRIVGDRIGDVPGLLDDVVGVYSLFDERSHSSRISRSSLLRYLWAIRRRLEGNQTFPFIFLKIPMELTHW